MKTKNKFLAIIPARKNSKGLKNKNKLLFNGKPLFYWPILAATNSKFIDRVVVSSDDNDILIKSKNFDKYKKIDFIKRPRKYSLDHSKSSEFIMHALDFFTKNNIFFEYIVLLEPTSPLTTAEDVNKVCNMIIKDKKIDSIVSVSLNDKYHPSYNYELKKNNSMKSYLFGKNDTTIRRQDLKELYYLDGSIYVSKVSSFVKYLSFVQKKTKGIILESYKSIEIDSMIDFISAEAIIKNKNIL